MNHTQRFWRGLFFIFLIVALCGGMALPVTGNNIPARAAPQMRASTSIVISEFRTRGPNGGNDEFIELYNLSSSTVNVEDWRVGYSSSGGTPSDRYTFPAGSSLSPGQYFLLANSDGYSGSTIPDATYTQSLANDGGIAIIDGFDNIIDQVGMSSGSNYKEPTDGSGILAPLTADNNQSYERKIGVSSINCNDTDNNAADFVLNSSSSNPQNLSSPQLACLRVVSVTSSPAIGTFNSTSPNIFIQVTFSSTVVVTSSPRLLLETGATDTAAVYDSGTGTNILTFRYVIEADDATTDLDYESVNALTLNGGSIVGPFGDAILTLPLPGSAGSLGANSAIAIDNGAAPALVSFTRQTPTANPTNADTVTFRATFSEAVSNVTADDFAATGITAPPAIDLNVNVVSASVYDVRVSGGNLDTLTGPVGLDLNPAQNITDTGGLALPTVEPSIDETYAIDNTAPAVTISLAAGQAATTDVLPVNFTIQFSKPIVPSSFVVADITQTGTAGSVTWTLTATPAGSTTTFRLSATSLASNGTLIPSIAAGRVTDAAGNPNTASINSTVTFADTTRPTVTITQASGQADPTASIPIRFEVVFSEPINTQSLAINDIRQTGTATGIVWNITDSGNHRNFTLSITDVTGAGTIVPFMPANLVVDLVGNANVDSAGGDNSVTFTRRGAPSVVISEFRTQGPNGADDEFIELYNPTVSAIDISGWKISGSNASGKKSTRATIPKNTLLRSGQYYLVANSIGYNMSVPANLTYSAGIEDKGGIALLKANGTSLVDAVGMSTGSAYREGSALAPLHGNLPQSYERLLGGDLDSCQDTNRNTVDFVINLDPSPRNYTSRPLRLCGTEHSNPITTTLTITAHTPNPSLAKEYVKVSVSLTGKSLARKGIKINVTGANKDCTITLNSSGMGSCTVQFTTTGTKTITATYLGNNDYLGSKATVSHSVVISTPTRVSTRVPTSVPPPPLVAINEFVPRPGRDWNSDGLVNTGDEYIELLNHGVVDVNLSGYRLDDEANIGSDPYSLPSVTLKPGERIVFYGKETGLLLSDGGDGVRLLKPNGQLVDAYNYSVVRFPDQSYCRLPDNGGLDDWNEACFPTPGLQNSLSQNVVNPPTIGGQESLCPISDTLPDDFAFAECQPFGNNIWNPAYWDQTGWFDEKNLPESPGKSPVFAE